jgi:hypothetical protein
MRMAMIAAVASICGSLTATAQTRDFPVAAAPSLEDRMPNPPV